MPIKEERTLGNIITQIIMYSILGVGVLVTFAPFYAMFVWATKLNEEIFRYPPPMWFGTGFIKNLQSLLEQLPFFLNLWNSLYIATLATVLSLFFCSLAGYAFAMYEFKGKEKLFILMIATMMIPPLLGIIPFYMLMYYIGWINTGRALYIPGAANAFGIFLMRQYMTGSLPRELLDSGRLDGCTEFQLYYRIVLPIIKPALGALGIIMFVGSWNNFLGALVILKDKAHYTVPVALRCLQGLYSIDWGAIMCGTAIATLPLFIAFLAFSKQFISGLTAGAVKR